jgi:hypothetical protein
MAAKRKSAKLKKAERKKPKAKAKAIRKAKTAKGKAKPAALAPQETMMGLITGFWLSQLVFVAAKLGLADRLAKGPLTAEDLAAEIGADARCLYRVLRALASLNVFNEDKKRRFKLTKIGQTLRSGAKGSLRDFALMQIDDYNRAAWGGLEGSVRTGRTAFDEVHQVPFFGYLQAHPERDRQFSASMASISGSQNEAIAAAYPFGALKRLVDVGGAHGHLLATILKQHKTLGGVLFDQPQVVAQARESGFIGDGLAKRCSIEGGDFFAAVPEGADGYLMKFIIHDWDDEKAVKILENCRKAMVKGGRVLLAEIVLPKDNKPNFGKLLDINMMVIPGGRERTKEEFAQLFQRAGLKLKRIVPSGPVSIIEAVAA